MTRPELAIAVVRELLHRSGALRTSVLIDRGDGGPGIVVECERLGPVRVFDGDEVRELAHDAGAEVALPGFPELRQPQPFEVDPAEGSVAGPLGTLQMLAGGMRDLAVLLGGGSVVAAEYPTHAGQPPLGLAARTGEPVVVLLGDEAFELDP